MLKKIACCTCLLLLFSLSVAAVSPAFDFTLFNDRFDGGSDTVIFSSLFFSELYSYIPVVLPEASAIVDTWTNQKNNQSADFDVNKRFRTVFFSGPNTGIAAGIDGIYRFTANAGKTWNGQDIGTNKIIYNVHISGSTAYTVGDSGTLRNADFTGYDYFGKLESDSGDSGWVGAPSVNNNNLFDVHVNNYAFVENSVFNSKTLFVAVGIDGTLLYRIHTNNVIDTALRSVTTPFITSEHLFGVHFDNTQKNIWAVGANGTIVHTGEGIINGTWAAQTSGTSHTLNKVYFVDSNRGWVVGDSGTILHTVDGGETWSSQTSNTTNSLYGLSFINSNDGWVVGGDGTILYTTNGGITWDRQTSGTTETLYAIDVYDTNNAWAVGENGTILRGANEKILLEDATPDLDLYNGTLSFKFDGVIDVSNIVLSEISITDRDGKNGVRMTGATTSNSDSDSITIFLNESQRQLITLLQHGPKSPLQIDVSTVAINDTSGKNFVGISNGELTVADVLSGIPWESQDSTVTTRLLDVHFVNSTNGWAVGNDGKLLGTTNGGTTWSEINTGISTHIRGVHFTNVNDGWIVGNSGIVRTTADGGATWSSQNSGTTEILFAVFFSSSSNGYAVGNKGNIIHTTNGGTTWVAQTSTTTNDLRDVIFANTGRGYAVGANGTFLATSNGGTTWNSRNLGTDVTINGVDFDGSNLAWVVGDGGTIRSTATLFSNSGSWVSQNSGVDVNLSDVQFIDRNRGWAAGVNGIIIFTTNGGTTWEIQDTPTTETLRSIHFTDSQRGWAVGDNGTIISGLFSDTKPPLQIDTTPDFNLGTGTLRLEFDEPVYTTAARLSGIQITDGDGENGVTLSGSTLSDTHSNIITISMNESKRQSVTLLYRTTNAPLEINVAATAVRDISGNNFAGITSEQVSLLDVLPINAWERQDIKTSGRLLDVHFIDADRGWAVGDGGVLRTTTNGGNTWSDGSVGIDSVIRGVHFVDSNRGWAVGNGGVLRTTADGGTTWNAPPIITGESLHDIHFVGTDNGWAVGDNGAIIRTTNGGTTWSNSTSGITLDLRGIHFSGPGRPGWAVGVGGTIINTPSPNGQWSAQTSGVTETLNDVYFIDANRGWAVGAGGTILGTVNRGATWSVLDSGVSTPLNSVHFIDSDQGWAAGSNGLILTTNNGGATWSNQSTPGTQSLFGIHFTDSGRGWAVGNNEIILHGIFSDTQPPLLIDDTPDIDLNIGTLLLEFNETINASATVLSGITITDSKGKNNIVLTGATLPSSDSNTLEISLKESQRLSILLLMDGPNTPLQIDVSATAISDSVGNKFAGITNEQMSLLDALYILEWEQQGANITVNRLLGAHFVNTTLGWAVGNNGTRTTTNDGGTTWSAGTVGVTNHMRDVYFLNSNRGWAVGNGGELRITTDLGRTWNQQSTPTTNDLFGIHFINSNNGWAVGNDGTVIRTTNGGTTWSVSSSDTTMDLRSVHFSGPGRPGWAVGAGGTIINTPSPDGQWSVQTSGVTETLNDVYFIDANRGWAVGAGGTILGTVNRGASWNVLYSGVSTPLNSVHFIDSDQGWAAGSNGLILATNNGGATWISQNTPTTQSLFAIHFVGLSDGWAVGNNGTILHGVFLDTTSPVLIDETPNLVLDLGTLHLKFDEVIDVSTIMLSEIIITDSGDTDSIPLTDATLSNTDSSTLAIFLTESQRRSIITLQSSTTSALQIDVTATAIRDTAGNAFTGLVDAAMTVTQDAIGPILIDATPDLYLHETPATLTFVFNEEVDVSATALTQITITDSNGEGGINMAGASLPDTDTATLVISLTDHQRKAIILLQDGANTPLQIDVSAIAIRDNVGGSTFAGITDGDLSVFAYWISRDSHVDSTLLSVYFLDADNGWAVGESGQMVETTNGGKTWDELPSGVRTRLWDVHFVDSNRGWAVGGTNLINGTNTGTIRTTTDGGTTWSYQQNNSTQSIGSVHFLNSTHGWAVGSSGTILRTTDGGTVWELKKVTSLILNDVFFINADRGWITGNSGTILYTIDGGDNWTTLISRNHPNLYAVHFIDQERGWAVGLDGTILTTVNGTHWTLQDDGGLGEHLQDVHFINANDGWIVGTNGTILATDNGGTTWNVQLTPTDDDLYGLYFSVANQGWAVGEGGTILRGIFSDIYPPLLTDATSDLDLHNRALLLKFDEIIDVSATLLSEIVITDSNGENGIVLTNATLPVDDSNILTIQLNESLRRSILLLLGSTDTPLQIDVSATAIRDIAGDRFAGIVDGQISLLDALSINTWVKQNVNTTQNLFGTYFINSTHGWVVGQNGALVSTIDGGADWSVGSVGTNYNRTIRNVQFLNTTHGWAVGDNGTLFISNGTTFVGSVGFSTNLHDVHFINSTHGWAVGNNGTVLDLTGSGRFLADKIIGSADLFGVYFSGQNSPGWAVGEGGAIFTLLTHNGQWISQSSGVTANLNDVHFIDPNRGWAVGVNGTIIGTVDRGVTWTNQTSGTTEHLNGVYFKDANNGYAAGANGTIITTTDGGETWSLQNTPSSQHLRDIYFGGPSNSWAVGNNGTILQGVFLDMIPPLLIDLTPDLDLVDGTLLLEFDEIIDVSVTMLSEITITDSDGENEVILTGAVLPNTNSSAPVFTLDGSQIESLTILLQNTTNTPLLINIGNMTIKDLAGNAFAGLVGAELEVIIPADQMAPTLALIGPDIVSITQGTTYTDPGATCTDNIDGTIPVITINSTAVDNANVGSYN